jgi:hypothetical protein
MIPKGAAGVGHIASRLVADLMPRASDLYMATDLAYLSLLLAMVAQDYDRSADVFVAEEREIVPILRDAAPHLNDETLRTRIAAAIDHPPKSLRVSDLTARSDTLLRLLIDVHAEVEVAEADGAAWASELNKQIWRFLEAHASRRAYEVPV